MNNWIKLNGTRGNRAKQKTTCRGVRSAKPILMVMVLLPSSSVMSTRPPPVSPLGPIGCPQVSTDIIHFLSKKLHYYKGDYDTFVNVRTELAKNQRRAYEASAAKKAHMQEFIDKFRSNAKRASLVQSRIKVRKRNRGDKNKKKLPSVLLGSSREVTLVHGTRIAVVWLILVFIIYGDVFSFCPSLSPSRPLAPPLSFLSASHTHTKC